MQNPASPSLCPVTAVWSNNHLHKAECDAIFEACCRLPCVYLTVQVSSSRVCADLQVCVLCFLSQTRGRTVPVHVVVSKPHIRRRLTGVKLDHTWRHCLQEVNVPHDLHLTAHWLSPHLPGCMVIKNKQVTCLHEHCWAAADWRLVEGLLMLHKAFEVNEDDDPSRLSKLHLAGVSL